MKDKKQKIVELLGEVSERELYCLYNDYASAIGYEQFYEMEEFDEFLRDLDPYDIATKIYYGDFRPNDEYFTFDGCGNLRSFDYPSEEMCFGEIADYMIENNEDFGWCDAIREILDEEDGEE